MAGQTVKVLLQYKLTTFEVFSPVSTTFGNLKEVAERSTGIPAANLKLLFRGREKPDSELLMAAGVKHGSRIQIVETSEYRESRPDPAAAYQPHESAYTDRPGPGQTSHAYASNSTNGSQAHASARGYAHAHSSSNNRAPDSWEQFSSSGPSHAYSHTQSGGLGEPVSASAHSYAHAHAHSPSPSPQPQASPRQSRFDATPHTSPRPGSSAQASPQPGSSAHPSPRGQPAPNGLPATSDPAERVTLQKIARVQQTVNELTAKAEALLGQPVHDKKALRGVEEQFTQQLLALDQLEVTGESRAARKAQINRINQMADRLEAVG